MWCIINVDSPLPVASQYKLVMRATEIEINAAHGPIRLGEDFIFISEHQNRHKSYLLHCVLINRPVLSLLLLILPRNGNCLRWL